MTTISWDDFMNVELRVGTVVAVDEFPEARQPAFILHVDFGEPLGIRKSSAQITDRYDRASLVGRQVVAVTNFPPKQIGPIMSECLVTGFRDDRGHVVLCIPDDTVPRGARLV